MFHAKAQRAGAAKIFLYPLRILLFSFLCGKTTYTWNDRLWTVDRGLWTVDSSI
jgi:hypothetical protein